MENEIDDETISSDEESCNRRFLGRINPVSLKYPLGCFTLVKRIFHRWLYVCRFENRINRAIISNRLLNEFIPTPTVI